MVRVTSLEPYPYNQHAYSAYYVYMNDKWNPVFSCFIYLAIIYIQELYICHANPSRKWDQIEMCLLFIKVKRGQEIHKKRESFVNGGTIKKLLLCNYVVFVFSFNRFSLIFSVKILYYRGLV